MALSRGVQTLAIVLHTGSVTCGTELGYRAPRSKRNDEYCKAVLRYARDTTVYVVLEGCVVLHGCTAYT
eukprot:3426954-Rhodomonas_salina.1